MTTTQQDNGRGKWQPIETAPDGRAVLVYAAGSYGLAKMTVVRREAGKWFLTGRYRPTGELVGPGIECPTTPTHWQPLPSPPEVEK